VAENWYAVGVSKVHTPRILKSTENIYAFPGMHGGDVAVQLWCRAKFVGRSAYEQSLHPNSGCQYHGPHPHGKYYAFRDVHLPRESYGCIGNCDGLGGFNPNALHSCHTVSLDARIAYRTPWKFSGA
jgi:hypothetical protein